MSKAQGRYGLASLSCLAALSLTACGPNLSDPGPGGLSIEDAKQLEAAAKKVDERSAPAQTAAETETEKPKKVN